jgi:hypothetical protein
MIQIMTKVSWRTKMIKELAPYERTQEIQRVT